MPGSLVTAQIARGMGHDGEAKNDSRVNDLREQLKKPKDETSSYSDQLRHVEARLSSQLQEMADQKSVKKEELKRKVEKLTRENERLKRRNKVLKEGIESIDETVSQFDGLESQAR